MSSLGFLEVAADLISPTPTDDSDPMPWVCWLEECDGEPHAGFSYKHARTKQRPPLGDWFAWLVLTGRGWGKTRVGAEWIAQEAWRQSGTEWAIVSPTFNLTRSVCVEGRSGVLNILRDKVRIGPAGYNRSNYELTLLNNSKIFLYGAAEPERGARGRNLSGAWCDEFASWSYREVWDEILMPALRIGEHPRVVVTTTPKPVPLLKELLTRGDDANDGSVIVTRGSIFENEANLSAASLDEMRRMYEGTHIGRQELYGEMVDDVEGALWTRRVIDDNRTMRMIDDLDLVRIVVAVDPAVTATKTSAETGVIIAGIDANHQGWVIGDATCKLSPLGWAKQVAKAYQHFDADLVVAEQNHGYELVRSNLLQVAPDLPVRLVHAKKAKHLRAQPIAALYENGRIHHVGVFADLEAQMCTWTPEDTRLDSPDRIDALVYALSELFPTASRPVVLQAADRSLSGGR